jgi:hypothetical protein
VTTARTLLLTLSLTLLAAAPAAAATYAAPNASGDCSQASPCDLQTAVTQASSQADKTAIALPGDYIRGSTVMVSGVTLQGTPGADVAGPGGGHPALSVGGGAVVEGLVVDGFDSGGSAVEITDAATIRDTVVRAASRADAVLVDGAGGGTLANVTAYASGGGAGLHVALSALAAPAVDSSILHADAPGAAVQQDGLAAPTFDHTNHGEADPLFVNQPADLRLRAGSPAVDAGAAGPSTGTSDPDGLPRQHGAAIDQGAYELTPPAVAAAPVADVTQTSATFNGSIAPNARETQWSLLYGTSPAALASRPGTTLPAGLASVPVQQGLTDLTPGTTYYVSLVASSSAGAVASPLVTFATGAPPAAAPAPLPPRRAATVLLLGSSNVRLSRTGKALISLQCPRVELYSCQGVLALRSVKALRLGRSPKRRIVFGSLRFDVPAGRTLRIGPRTTRAKAALVRRLRKVPVAVSVITQGASLDDQRFFSRRFTLLPPR